MLDRDYAYQDRWQMAGDSEIFEGALRFIYDDHDQQGIICVLGLLPALQGCEFGAAGLVSVDQWGEEIHLPYERLVVLHVNYDGRVELLESLPPDYLTTGVAPGYDPLARLAENAALPPRVHTAFPCWPLDGCLEYPAPRAIVDHARFEMDEPPPGGGWEGVGGPSGEIAPVAQRWTILPNAGLYVRLASGHDYQLAWRLTYAITPDILQSLTVLVNGETIPFTQRVDEGGGILMEGVIPAAVVDLQPANTVIIFRTAETVSPASLGLNADERRLGLLFDWIEIGPVD